MKIKNKMIYLINLKKQVQNKKIIQIYQNISNYQIIIKKFNCQKEKNLCFDGQKIRTKII